MADSAASPDPASPQGLRGWFGKIRRRRWVALFVFEFFVVLLGVLAAQGLQSWFQSRQEERVAAATKATLERNLRSIALSVEARRRGLACYNNRLNLTAQAMNRGEPIAVAAVPPEEALVIDLGWSGEVPGLIAEHYGPELANTYVNAALWVDALKRAQAREQESWTDLARLSGRLGPITAADLTAAKGALIDARRDLLNISWATGHLSDHVKNLNVRPDLSELSGMRSDPDPCKKALSYSLEDHRRAQQAGRLVTGETLTLP